jgi:hypothetical protein
MMMMMIVIDNTFCSKLKLDEISSSLQSLLLRRDRLHRTAASCIILYQYSSSHKTTKKVPRRLISLVSLSLSRSSDVIYLFLIAKIVKMMILLLIDVNKLIHNTSNDLYKL